MDRGLVIDVGANNGDDTAHYLARGFRVVAVEADPRLVAHLERRFAAEIADGRLVVEGVGIAPEAGSATFYVNPAKSEWSAFDIDAASRGGAATAVTVATVTARELLGRHGVPYYLKVDIEGNDGLCLDALDPADLPEYVSVEAHALEYLARLWSVGYREFRIVDQHLHHFRPLPGTNARPHHRALRTALHYGRLARLRLGIVKPRFPVGSSGPMPDQRPEPWQDLETVAYRWLHWRTGHHRRGDLNPLSWFDFHARRPRPD